MSYDDYDKKELRRATAFGAAFGNPGAGLAFGQASIRQRGGHVKTRGKRFRMGNIPPVVADAIIGFGTLTAITIGGVALTGHLHTTNPVREQNINPEISSSCTSSQTSDIENAYQPEISFTYEDETLTSDISDSQTNDKGACQDQNETEIQNPDSNIETTAPDANSSLNETTESTVSDNVKGFNQPNIESILTDSLEQGQ